MPGFQQIILELFYERVFKPMVVVLGQPIVVSGFLMYPFQNTFVGPKSCSGDIEVCQFLRYIVKC